MVENESARQAGSNDTMLDLKLVTDGFAVRMLPSGLSGLWFNKKGRVWYHSNRLDQLIRLHPWDRQKIEEVGSCRPSKAHSHESRLGFEVNIPDPSL